MATRLYFSHYLTPLVTPALGGWSTTSGFDRRVLVRTSADDIVGLVPKSTGNVGNLSANQTFLNRQYVSDPMRAGNIFDTGVTVKGQVQVYESAVNDNINRLPIMLKIVSWDGGTIQATPLALAVYGPSATEWQTNPDFINRRLADGDALTGSYTTVAGDRIVLEIGGQVSSAGGVSVNGTQFFGGSEFTGDLPENDTAIVIADPWFEFSLDILFEQFEPPQSPGPHRKLYIISQPTIALPALVAVPIFPDSWSLQGPEPTQVKRVLIPGGLTFDPNPPAPVFADSWYQQHLLPLPHRREVQLEFPFVPTVAPILTDSWYQQQNLPLTVRPALPVEQPFVPMVAPPAPPAVDGRIVVQHDFDLIIPPSGTIMY